MSINRYGLIPFGKSLYKRFKSNDIAAIGAELAYYLLLAIFPFLIFLISLLGLFRLSTERFINEFIAFLPGDTANIVQQILQEVSGGSSGALLSFSMLGTIWSASKGIKAVMKGLNKAYETEETRPFWKVTALSLLSTVALAAIVVFAMALLVFGEAAGKLLYGLLGEPQGFASVLGLIKYALPGAVMILLFGLLYNVIPSRRLGFMEVWPGALFACVGWIATSLLFQYYINHFGSYTKTYGSLGGVIALLIWLYISSLILLAGGEINALLAANRHRRRLDTRPAAQAGAGRHAEIHS